MSGIKSKLHKFMVSGIVLISLILVACNENTEKVPVTSLTEEPATSVIKLPVELSTELTGVWEKIDGSTATIPLTAALHDHLGKSENAPEHHTTPDAYQYLLEKSADLIFVTYPSQNEFDMARDYGIEMEIIPVTKDALVFLVNIDNPVENITLAQLRDIYTGKITDWNELNGVDGAILPFQRTPDSGSQTLMLKLLMAGREPMTAPTEWVFRGMGSLVEVISNYDYSKDAIGYSMFYYVNNMYGNSRFKLLGIDDIKPDRNTIMKEEYPLSDCYYAVIRKDTPADSPVRQLIDWMLTDEGQALAARAGYIPLRQVENIWPDQVDYTMDPVYIGDTELSAGTGGTEFKGWSANENGLVSEGVRSPLSDVFYDDYNYIRYINREITNQLLLSEDESNENILHSEWQQVFSGEDKYAKRSFTGIPNNYPNYELREQGYLTISFPKENPFFTGEKNFYIPLPKAISPYGIGEGFVNYNFVFQKEKQLAPNVDFFSYQIEILDAPDIAELINEHLEVWLNEGVESMKEFAEWYSLTESEYPYRYLPMMGQWENYLSISYAIQSIRIDEAGMGSFISTIYTICFDLVTGEEVNLIDVFPDIPYEKANWIGPVDSSETLADNYIPAEGTVIDEAWIWQGMFLLSATEPNGRKLSIQIPLY